MECAQIKNLYCLNPQYSTTRLVSRELPKINEIPGAKLKNTLFPPHNPDRKAEGGLRTKGYFKKTCSDAPLTSVITVVFNGEKHLEETILSVINQSYDNVEYIIVDGGSTDGTLEIIKRYDDVIDYWVSEIDCGISDAFNKGITLAAGCIIGILNADDWYEPDAIKSAVETIVKSNSDVSHGILQFWRGHRKAEIVAADSDLLMREMTINHPTVFMKRRVYENIGLFRLDMKYAMDYELILRAKCNHFNFTYIDQVVANMRLCGVSDRQWVLALFESYKSKKINCPTIWDAAYLVWDMFKGIIRRLFEKIGLWPIVRFYHKHLSSVSKTSDN